MSAIVAGGKDFLRYQPVVLKTFKSSNHSSHQPGVSSPQCHQPRPRRSKPALDIPRTADALVSHVIPTRYLISRIISTGASRRVASCTRRRPRNSSISHTSRSNVFSGSVNPHKHFIESYPHHPIGRPL